MNWTTEKPTRPGWYWIRRFEDLAAEPEMVNVYEADGALYVKRPDHRVEELIYVNGEWAGPIEPSA